MVTQIFAGSASEIFIQGRVMFKKKTVYFLAVCVNLPCKIEKVELEGVGMDILWTGFCFQGSH